MFYFCLNLGQTAMNLMTKLDAVTIAVSDFWRRNMYVKRIILKEDDQPSAVTVARRVSIPIGLYRENAIAIQDESGDSNGGNV